MTSIHSFIQSIHDEKNCPKVFLSPSIIHFTSLQQSLSFLSLHTAMKTTIDAIGAVFEQNLIQGETNADGSTIISEGFFL